MDDWVGNTSSPGYINNTNSRNARLNNPKGLAMDGSSLIIADFTNNAIRKVTNITNTSSGNRDTTTIAGTGSYGFVNGAANAARFDGPYDICVYGSYIYIADHFNHAIRRLNTSTQQVTTFAGGGTGTNGLSGYVDATGTDARFTYPTAICADSNGNLYVVERYRIRRITPAGEVSTVMGTGSQGIVQGTGTNASMGISYGIVVNPSNSRILYVTDATYHYVRRIDLE